MAVLQTFMTPGCFFLNMLAGSMYGVPVAMVMVVLASTLGACINYWLSRLLVKVSFHIRPMPLESLGLGVWVGYLVLDITVPC